ncbi:hypothetical protein [Actinomadura macra]|uniref:hypothetical protein n=1 Tax=Actinomadura macra TaxID=46164 RepID=UPI0012FB2FA1|nr:hypothetical protein [Actinomadura macra]
MSNILIRVGVLQAVTDSFETAHPYREGIRAFQLRLLVGIGKSEAMVELALRQLGADQSEMEHCRTAAGNIYAHTGRFENVTSILGPPLASETVHYERGEATDALASQDGLTWPRPA